MMTEDQTYNGWTNYATWGVALVLNNDQGTQSYVRELADDAREEAPRMVEQFGPGTVGVEDQARYLLADKLQSVTEDLCGLEDDEGPSLMARQVIQAGLAEVDWDEIAGNILSEDQ